MSGHELPEDDMLTSTPPGSPPWAYRYPVSSVVEVLFDAVRSYPAIKDHAHAPTSDALQPSSTTTDDAHTPTSSMSLTKMNDIKDPAPNHPIDIFGTIPGHSAYRNDSEMSMEPRINRFKRIALRVPKQRQAVAAPESLNEKLESLAMIKNELLKERLESLGILSRRSLRKPVAEIESSNGKTDIPRTLSPRPRRIASRTDHPLECDMPLQIQDAESLDLENKIRSALRQRKTLSRSDIIHKSVRFDPAIISLGSERRSVKSESATSKPVPHYEPTIPKDAAAAKDKGGPRLKDSLQTILSLKKQERAQLRELLDNLSKIEDSPPIAHSASLTGARLNPLAPEFHGSPRSIYDVEDPNNCYNGWSTLPSFPSHHRPSLLPIWIHTPKPIGLLAEPIFPTVPTIQKAQPIRTPIPIVKPYLTTDDGSGREAKVVDPDWAKSILETFAAKYPLTGKLRAGPPADSKGRRAATIQQRLEYLLMEEREKKALRARSFEEENEKNKENIDPPKQ